MHNYQKYTSQAMCIKSLNEVCFEPFIFNSLKLMKNPIPSSQITINLTINNLPLNQSFCDGTYNIPYQFQGKVSEEISRN